VTTPYIPFAPTSVMRMFYLSTCQVLRNDPQLNDSGSMVLGWTPVTDIVDPILDQPGLLACRLDLQFVRPGKDAPAPLVAGRAPDRVGVCFFDLAADAAGAPLVRAGDRLECVAGPVYGTFELRQIPDVAQDLTGGHHVETQVIEVSQQLQPGTPTPFPGSPALWPSSGPLT
jgi:hypothetical protein